MSTIAGMTTEGVWVRDVKALRRQAGRGVLALFSFLLDAFTAGQVPQVGLLVESQDLIEPVY